VDIYVYMRGQRRGPYEKLQLEAMWKVGQIPVDTLYWHDGMSMWAVISDLFADTELERSRLNVKEEASGASRPVTLSQLQLAASAASTSGKI